MKGPYCGFGKFIALDVETVCRAIATYCDYDEKGTRAEMTDSRWSCGVRSPPWTTARSAKMCSREASWLRAQTRPAWRGRHVDYTACTENKCKP